MDNYEHLEAQLNGLMKDFDEKTGGIPMRKKYSAACRSRGNIVFVCASVDEEHKISVCHYSQYGIKAIGLFKMAVKTKNY